MITLSKEAVDELNAFFEGKDKATIRVFLAPGGCSGPRLALALDDAGDADVTEEVDGFTFCVNKDLQDQIKSAKIEVTPMGFMIEPEVPLPDTGGAGGCGGCCGGCGSN